MLTHGQLFAGIGGFGLAAQWAGIKNVWANEIDPFCCKVLRKNFPDCEIIEDDIREVTFTYTKRPTPEGVHPRRGGEIGVQMEEQSVVQKGRNEIATRLRQLCETFHELKPVDIISGGFPCQPFSHAGKRQGTTDDRYLWPEMLRVIQEVRPSWVVGENVAGLTSMENGKTLDRILTDLEDSGYHTETFSIPACSVGAWHRRQRIWIVANKSKPGLQDREGPQMGEQKPEQEFERQNSPPTGLQKHKQNGEPGSAGETIPNTLGKRLEGMELRTQQGRNQRQVGLHSGTGGGQRWDTKPGLGLLVDGLPSELAGYWDQEPEGIPRTTTKSKYRKEKLMALGNAIVPQVAFEIFKAIIENEN